uniref:RFX-type winged-helix domain-containing protein n=1 Tax=Anopheles coluzzii TaxID=1518534 RepID=A0A8W7PSY1_ANOCL
MHAGPPLLTVPPSPGSGTVSSSTATPLPQSPAGPAAGGPDFLAQMAVNKLKVGKLNASYELTAASSSATAASTELELGELGAEQEASVAAMRAMLASSGCHNPAALGDREREQQIQQIFEKSISDNTKKQILEILEKISTLRPPERLLLYLRMPGGYPETDPLRQSQNPLGTRLEINHTINWVRSHLEHDPNVSIPKQEVYDDYVAYCARINIKPLSTADFGKVMKQVFPGIRPRRLGTRGHSRYCYAAMRKATKLPSQPNEGQHYTEEESWKVVKGWAEAMLPSCFTTINELAGFIAKNNLNSPSGLASRQQLHKKILQREMKEKRKLSKRLKLLQQRQQRSLEAQNNSAPRYDEQGNLILIETQDSVAQDEFIIPRERVISICNMDKNALDGYLNCDEENSQDQDQELLKYFPEEDGGGDGAAGGPSQPKQLLDASAEHDGTTGGGAASSAFGGTLFDDNEKLFQIRMILEKNQCNQNKQQMLQQQQQQQQQQHMQQTMESHLAAYDTVGSMGQGGAIGLQPGSAAASLAALSQRHNTSTGEASAMGGAASTAGGPHQPHGAPEQHQRQQLKHEAAGGAGGAGVAAGGSQQQGYGVAQMNGGAVAGGGPALALQSPTARRKNFSFVPISEQPRVGSGGKPLSGGGNINHTPTASPFVSPRSTPIHRKAHKASNGLTLNLMQQHGHQPAAAAQQQQQLQQQLSHAGGGAYGQHHQQQQPPHQTQSRSYLGGYIKNELSASAPPSPSMMQPYRFGAVGMNGLNCGLSPMPTTFQPICNPHGSLSSSTGQPGQVSSLESRSSSVPLIPNYDPYCNSNYNSVSQTPVPSEYDDFTDTAGNILDMLNEQSSQLCIGPMGPTGGSSGLGLVTGTRSLFELPKSVPSTPIGLNEGSCPGESMFQYSPETSRDFLINGNSVDRSKSSAASFYSPVAGGPGGTTATAGVPGTLALDANGSDSCIAGSGPAGADVTGELGVAGPHTAHSGAGNGRMGGSRSSCPSATADPIVPPSADLANLSDGIEGLSNELDSMAESMINSDILRNL